MEYVKLLVIYAKVGVLQMGLVLTVILVTSSLLVLVSSPNKSSPFNLNLEVDQLQLLDALNKKTEFVLDVHSDTICQLVLVSQSAIYATLGLLMVLVSLATLVTSSLLVLVSFLNKSSPSNLNLEVDQLQLLDALNKKTEFVLDVHSDTICQLVLVSQSAIYVTLGLLMVLVSLATLVTSSLLVLVSFLNKSSPFNLNLEVDQLQLLDALNKKTEFVLDVHSDTTCQLGYASQSAIYVTLGLLMVLVSLATLVTSSLLVLVSFLNKSSPSNLNLEVDQLQLLDVLNKKTEFVLDVPSDTIYQLVLVSQSAIYATLGLLMVLVSLATLVTSSLLVLVSFLNKSSPSNLNLEVDQLQLLDALNKKTEFVLDVHSDTICQLVLVSQSAIYVTLGLLMVLVSLATLVTSSLLVLVSFLNKSSPSNLNLEVDQLQLLDALNKKTEFVLDVHSDTTCQLVLVSQLVIYVKVGA
jgi:TRAP-type C4-dicarboxylate transport system permease small subunit